jgi:hypothetical protein
LYWLENKINPGYDLNNIEDKKEELVEYKRVIYTIFNNQIRTKIIHGGDKKVVLEIFELPDGNYALMLKL